jgi:hypothetical protein
MLSKEILYLQAAGNTAKIMNEIIKCDTVNIQAKKLE